MYPQLGPDGFTNSPIRVADMMFCDFYISEPTQTYLYKGQVQSLPSLLKQYQGDIPEIIDKTQSYLQEYFSKEFYNVVVKIEQDLSTLLNSAIQLNIFIQFQDILGNQYSLGKLIQYNDTTIKEVKNLINGV
jgi:hypothetical protein